MVLGIDFHRDFHDFIFEHFADSVDSKDSGDYSAGSL